MSEVGVIKRRCPQVRRHEVCPVQLSFIERSAVQCDPGRVNTAQVRFREGGAPALRSNKDGVIQLGVPKICIVEQRVVQDRHRQIGRLGVGLHQLRPFQIDTFQIGLL